MGDLTDALTADSAPTINALLEALPGDIAGELIEALSRRVGPGEMTDKRQVWRWGHAELVKALESIAADRPEVAEALDAHPLTPAAVRNYRRRLRHGG